MNPLSPLTYYVRHKRSALILMALVCLTTLGLYVMVSVLDSIPTRGRLNYLTRVALVSPAAGTELEPGVLAQIETHPDVARVIPDNGLTISPPALVGYDSLRLMGVSPEDAQYLLVHLGVRLQEGRMCEPHADELVLSEKVARALGLRVGDQIMRTADEIPYAAVPAPLTLVGILEGDPTRTSGPSIRVGLVSRDYIEGHEAFAPRVYSVLVVAQAGREEAVNEFLQTTIASARTEIETSRELSQYVAMGRVMLGAISTVVNCLVAVVAALVVGVINRIALLERVKELGLLSALGYSKGRLVGRLTLETAAVAALGWLAGLALALLALYGLQSSVYYAAGQELDVWNLLPVCFVLPIPLVVVAFAYGSARRVLSRTDAVAIVEQGRLSIEEAGRKRRRARNSSARPLSCWTFHTRHGQRGVMMGMSVALMVLGIAFPALLFSSVLGAFSPAFAPLRAFSEVVPAGSGALDAGVAAQIRAHPAVARVLMAQVLGFQVTAPPGSAIPVNMYGVAADDLPALLELFDMQVVEGRLPQPRTNEIVISRALALNRGLAVGDAIGRPVQEREGSTIEDDIPGEMVIAGLLSRDDVWVGFASREYLENHELTAARPLHLLVVPVAGRKAELDDWLTTAIASPQVKVNSYAVSWTRHQQAQQGVAVAFGAVEFLVTAVAAVALAVLNYILIAQRRQEFGTLHALGHSRLWLVGRAVNETAIVVGLAWVASAVLCTLGLFGLQMLVYAPRGLNLLVDSTAWLLTLPIPLVVLAVAAGTVVRTLGRLDAVAVIEREC